MITKEIERVYLAKALPKDLSKSQSVMIKVGDFHNPTRIDALRIRQKGDKYEIIKKEGESLLNRTEHVIFITKEEFDILWEGVQWSNEKVRIIYDFNGTLCEIDFYQGELEGYCRVEVEFKDKIEAESFKSPDWFGPEITNLNHEIHKNLGKINFEEMKKRYSKHGIELNKNNYK